MPECYYYCPKEWNAAARCIKHKVRSRMPDLLQMLYPAGTRVGETWQVGDVYGNPGEALIVTLVGKWAGTDRERSGNTVDIIDMWKAVYGVGFCTAVRGLMGWYGSVKHRRRSCSKRPPTPDNHHNL